MLALLVLLMASSFTHTEEQMTETRENLTKHTHVSMSDSESGKHVLKFHGPHEAFDFRQPNILNPRRPRSSRGTLTTRFRRSYDDHMRDVSHSFSVHCEVLVYPVLGFLGIAGNVVTGVILRRSGLEKPTNVLLLALVISSISCLLPTVNIFSLLRQFNKMLPHDYIAWEYEPGKSRFAYFCFHATTFIFFQSRYGHQVTSSICVLITLERLVVIFFPMRIKSIITLKRTVAVVVFVHLLWLPLLIMNIRACKARVIYFDDVETYGLLLSFDENDLLSNIGQVSDWLCGIIPVTVIALGTITMSVKLGFILKNRRRLTSSLRGTHSLRLSKTLIVVCVLFCLCHTLEFVYLFKTFYYNENLLMGKLAVMLAYVDSASHFPVYILLNKNFRTVIVKIIRLRRQK